MLLTKLTAWIWRYFSISLLIVFSSLSELLILDDENLWSFDKEKTLFWMIIFPLLSSRETSIFPVIVNSFSVALLVTDVVSLLYVGPSIFIKYKKFSELIVNPAFIKDCLKLFGDKILTSATLPWLSPITSKPPSL